MNIKDKAFLKKSDFFSNYLDDELDIIVQFSEYISLKSEEILFNPGDPGDALYIVESGEISILKHAENNRKIEIARFLEGHSFGEMDFLKGSLRNASAQAVTDSRLLCFPKKGVNFEKILKEYPAVSARILHRLLVLISERIREANTLIKENSPVVQELRKQVYIDKMTGLYNKTFMEEKLDAFLQNQKMFSLLSVKPDNFKYINDNYGHDAGDEAIHILSIEMENIVNNNELLCRFMGNEMFVILLNTDRTSALNYAKMIKEKLNDLKFTPITKDKPFTLSVSIGISCYPEHGRNKKKLIEKAHELPLIGRSRGGNLILFPEDK